MPWRHTSPVFERMQFVEDVARGGWSMTELCARYGISRKTGYALLKRFREEGMAGLGDRTRRPRRSPNALSAEVVEAVLALKRRHPTWGPKKLLRRFRDVHPELKVPALSTVARLLSQRGLVKGRRRRRAVERVFPRQMGWGTSPNALWTADFKGEFRLGDGVLCYPLTIADSYSRYLLRCDARPSVHGAPARRLFERAFREYGVPDAILTDNGVPFGSSGLFGLTRLSVWWLKLGIQVQRITPGAPEENGRHERMHRTLKEEATRPASRNLRAQQARLEDFRREYNEERPHEGLAMEVPARCYQPSTRRYTGEPAALDYPAHMERRQVRMCGAIKWRGRSIFLSAALAEESVALEEVDNGLWAVRFGALELGRFAEGETRLRRASPSRRRRKTVLPMS